MTVIGEKWYVNKLNAKLTSLKMPFLRKEQQEKEYIIKAKLRKPNNHRNDFKLNIHWKKLEWVDPNKRHTKEKSFCV